MIKSFWKWYERNYQRNLNFASILFGLQIVHLYWMATHVLGMFWFGRSFFYLPRIDWLYALVDFTEIPALISVSFVYLYQIRKREKVSRSILYLFFLNIQWLHLFWITDEIIVAGMTGQIPFPLPKIITLGAILIDFLEIPVMLETITKAWRFLKI